MPGWSPDGKRIVVGGINETGGQRVYELIEVDAETGGNPVQLSKTGRQAANEQLSPDGRWVYFISFLPDKSVSQVYKVSIDGGESVPVTDHNYYPPPRFSPDGKLIIFTGKDENNQPLPMTVIEAATGKTIVPSEKINFDGHWSSDSRHLISARNANQ